MWSGKEINSLIVLALFMCVIFIRNVRSLKAGH